MPKHKAGAVVTITTRWSGAAAEPVTVTIEIPAGTDAGPFTMTDSGDGQTYTYEYTPATAGRYYYKAQTSAPISIDEGHFDVEAPRIS